MAESTTAYTRESLRPYYKTNPEPDSWKFYNGRIKNLNKCDFDKATLYFLVTAAALIGVAITVIVGCYTRPILGAGGYYTLVTFLAGLSAVPLGIVVVACRLDFKERKEDFARIDHYFNKFLKESELRSEVNENLDPTKLPDDLKKLIYV